MRVELGDLRTNLRLQLLASRAQVRAHLTISHLHALGRQHLRGAPHAAQFDVRLFLQTNRAHNSHNLHNNPIPHLPHQSLLHRRFPRDAALNALRRARRNPMRQPERLALAHMPILLAPHNRSTLAKPATLQETDLGIRVGAAVGDSMQPVAP